MPLSPQELDILKQEYSGNKAYQSMSSPSMPTSDEDNLLLPTMKERGVPVPAKPSIGGGEYNANLTPELMQRIESITARNLALKEQQATEKLVAAEEMRKAEQAGRYHDWATRSLVRGAFQTGASLAGLGTLAGELVDSEKLKEAGQAGYQFWSEKAAEIPGTQFGELKVTQPLTIGKWAIEKAIENAPYMLVSIGAGGVGANIASKVIPKVAGDFLAKQAIKSAGKTATDELIATTAQGIAKGLGAKAGVILSTAAIEGGGDYADIVERGLGSDKAALSTIVSSLAKGYVETLGGSQRVIDKILGTNSAGIFGRAANRIGNAYRKGKTPTPEDFGVIKRLYTEAFRIGGENALQEVVQEGFALTNIAYNDPTFKAFTAENFMRLLESGAAGFAVGAIMGAPAGAFTSRTEYAKERGWTPEPSAKKIFTPEEVNLPAGGIETGMAPPPPNVPTADVAAAAAGGAVQLESLKLDKEELRVGANTVIADIDSKLNALKNIKGKEDDAYKSKLDAFNVEFGEQVTNKTQKATLQRNLLADRKRWDKWEDNPTLVGIADNAVRKLRETQQRLEEEKGVVEEPAITPEEVKPPQEPPIIPETALAPPVGEITQSVAPIKAETIPQEKLVVPETQLAQQPIPEKGVINEKETEALQVKPTSKAKAVPVIETGAAPVKPTMATENPAWDRSPEVNRIRIEKARTTKSLADIKGVVPEKMITVYRAMPKGQDIKIEAGDFVSPNRAIAASYGKDMIRSGKTDAVQIKSIRVKSDEIRLHPNHQAQGVENEFIYSPEKVIDKITKNGHKYNVVISPRGDWQLYRKGHGIEERLPYDVTSYNKYTNRVSNKKRRLTKSKYTYIHESRLGPIAQLFLDAGVKLNDKQSVGEIKDLWDGIKIVGKKGFRIPYNKDERAATDYILERYVELAHPEAYNNQLPGEWRYTLDDAINAANKDIAFAINNKGMAKSEYDKLMADRYSGRPIPYEETEEGKHYAGIGDKLEALKNEGFDKDTLDVIEKNYLLMQRPDEETNEFIDKVRNATPEEKTQIVREEWINELGEKYGELTDSEKSAIRDGTETRDVVEGYIRRAQAEGEGEADTELQDMEGATDEDLKRFDETFVPTEGAVVPEKGAESTVTEVGKRTIPADLTTAITDLTDARTGETIPEGTPHYRLQDTGETVSEETYRKLTEGTGQGEAFAPGEVKKTGKEPWEMSQKAYIGLSEKEYGKGTEEATNAVKSFHKQNIIYALESNKPVSKEVLKDYPDLEAKYFQKKPPESELTAEDKQTSMLEGAEGLTGQHDIFEKPKESKAYVTGLKGKEFIFNKGSNIIQLSKNIEVAKQYMGKNGSTWIVTPKPDTKILDATNESELNYIKNGLLSDYENGNLTLIMDELIEQNGKESDNINNTVNNIVSEINPKNIVDSAGAFDNLDFNEWLWNKYEYDMVKTNDGAIVLNPDAVNAKSVSPEDVTAPAKELSIAKRGQTQEDEWQNAAITWQEMDIEGRGNVARRIGWVNQKGKLTKLGENISKSEWDGLSLAAKRLIRDQIKRPLPIANIIPNSRELDIRNMESMPRGLNARYLLALKGEGSEYIAKQWKRTIPKSFKPNEVLIDFKPEQAKGTPSRPLVNPHASALQRDKQLRAQQTWDKKYGEQPKYLYTKEIEPIDVVNDEPKLLAKKIRRQYYNVIHMPNTVSKDATERGKISAAKNQKATREELFAVISKETGERPREVGKRDIGGIREDAKIAQKIGLVFGNKPIFVAINDSKYGGMYYKGQIALNINTELDMVYTISHELTHSLAIKHPDLYQQLVDVLINEQETRTPIEKYIIQNIGRLKKYENLPENQQTFLVIEEFTADSVAERMTEKSFWRVLQKNVPEVVKQFYRDIVRIIRTISLDIKLKTSKYFGNLQTIRDTIDSVMAEYATREAKGGVQAKYSAKQIPVTVNQDGTVTINDFDGITLADVKEIFPKAKVSQIGTDFIVTQNGRSLKIYNVETISPNESAFKIGYGKLNKQGKVIAGEYKDGEIKISRYGDRWTLSHESYHWLEDLGVISALEKNALNLAAKKDKNIDHTISKDEQRAQYIESQLKLRTEARAKGIVNRAIQKIADFIDSLVNLVHTTARGVVRGMESGKIPGERVIVGEARGGEQYAGYDRKENRSNNAVEAEKNGLLKATQAAIKLHVSFDKWLKTPKKYNTVLYDGKTSPEKSAPFILTGAIAKYGDGKIVNIDAKKGWISINGKAKSLKELFFDAYPLYKGLTLVSSGDTKTALENDRYFNNLKPENIKRGLAVLAEETEQQKGGEKYSVRDAPLQTAQQTVPQRVYEEAKTKQQTIKSRLYNISHRGDEGWFARYLTPFSTRLEQINPQIKAAFRQFRNSFNQIVMSDVHAVKLLMDATKRMSKDDQIIFDLARKNADPGMLQRMIIKYGISKEYATFRKTMDNLYDRLIEVGYDVDYLSHQHPRVIKDPSGFLNHLYGTDAWGDITEAFKEAQEKQPNIPLSDVQKAHIANLVIRGYGGKRINLSAPGNILERKVELIDAELNQFYHDSNTALLIYITNMNKAIEARVFFGMRTQIKNAGKQYRKSIISFMDTQRKERTEHIQAIKKEFSKYKQSIANKPTEEKEKLIKEHISRQRVSIEAFTKKQEKNYEDTKRNIKKELGIKGTDIKEKSIENAVNASIGDYVAKLIKSGELKPEQEGELTRLFQDFFNYRSSTGMVDVFKNMGYATAMGNVSSSITQIGDIAFALYNAGIYETGKALGQAVTGRSRISKRDLALEKIAEEFSNPTKMSIALNKLFHWTGFEAMDRVGKEVLINSTISKYEKMAQTNETGLRKILEKMIPTNLIDETIADLKSAKVTDNVKLVAFNALTDFQPVDVGEMPIGYIAHPGGRVFYMMKTYYIKQIDAMRRESITKIRNGQVKEGLGNLVRFAAVIMLMNATADEIRDFMFQRDTKLSDNVLDNFMRLFGLSRYAMWRFREGGVKDAAVAMFAPPIDFVENPRKDFGAMLKLYKENKEIKEGDRKGKPKDFNIWNMQLWKSLPYAGQQMYWWFGGGHERVLNRRLSDPLKESKQHILAPGERQEFLDELKMARESGRITAQEARSKRGQFFRNQVKVKAKQTRHQTKNTK